MITLYILMICVFLGYTMSIVYNYGILNSISESYYMLSKKSRYLFTFFCWGFAIPAIIIGLDQTGSVLMFLAGAGICFAGTAGAFKESLTHDVHMGGAFVGILASQASIWFDYNLHWLPFLFIGIGIPLLILTKLKYQVRYFWWLEIVAFVSICIALFTKLI